MNEETEARVLTFAYGSSMDWCQMRYRCPSARFVDVAVLPDHSLAFTRWSKNRSCGVADAVPADGSEVWGVVYQIDETDIGSLDRSEGYQPGRRDGNSYVRETRQVLVDGNPKRAIEVQIYFAVKTGVRHKPNQAYKDLILSGARHWHLPETYIGDVLDRIEVARDQAPDDPVGDA